MEVARIERLQRFISFVRNKKLLQQSDVIRAVKRMTQLDRRVGQMAALQRFIDFGQINEILVAQLQNMSQFCETAKKMGIMTDDQLKKCVALQEDEIFAFSQAAILERLVPADQMIAHLREFSAADPPKNGDAAVSTSKPVDTAVKDILKKINGVAPLPGTVQKVLEMLDDPKTDMEKVGKVIVVDPAISTSLIRLVNSASYGMRSEVKTVKASLVVLGTKKIRQLVITAGVLDKFKGVDKATAAKFWDHSVRTGQWSKAIAGKAGLKDTEDIFIMGLIHNVGQLFIHEHFPNELERINTLVVGGKDDLAAEREVMRGTHADIGGFVFQQWKLPKTTVEATMLHHHSLELLAEMGHVQDQTKILHLSAALADVSAKFPDPIEFIAYGAEAFNRYVGLLTLNPDDFPAMAESVDKSVTEVKKLFGVG